MLDAADGVHTQCPCRAADTFRRVAVDREAALGILVLFPTTSRGDIHQEPAVTCAAAIRRQCRDHIRREWNRGCMSNTDEPSEGCDKDAAGEGRHRE
jgi:hypothetical protein